MGPSALEKRDKLLAELNDLLGSSVRDLSTLVHDFLLVALQLSDWVKPATQDDVPLHELYELLDPDRSLLAVSDRATARADALSRHGDTLELFIEKATKLENLGLRKKSDEVGIGLTLTKTADGEYETERQGPDSENLEAFLLTYRFFCQNSEATSLQNMAALIKALPGSPKLKSEFLQRRQGIIRFLSVDSGHVHADQHITNGKLLDVFLYGSLAHANKAKRQECRAWTENDIAREFMTSALIRILAILSRSIGALGTLAKDVLNQLGPRSAA